MAAADLSRQRNKILRGYGGGDGGAGDGERKVSGHYRLSAITTATTLRAEAKGNVGWREALKSSLFFLFLIASLLGDHLWLRGLLCLLPVLVALVGEGDGAGHTLAGRDGNEAAAELRALRGSRKGGDVGAAIVCC